MSQKPEDAAEAGLRIARAFAEAGLPYALGGALALGAHGVPRGTLDVDINVFVDNSRVPSVVNCLSALGVSVEVGTSQAAAEKDGMFVGHWFDIRIDVFVPSIPFTHEAEKTKVLLENSDGVSVYFLSVEALSVFKLLFFRGKDRVDLERLLAVQGAALNRSYVREWIVKMMGEDDERVLSWDALCDRFPG